MDRPNSNSNGVVEAALKQMGHHVIILGPYDFRHAGLLGKKLEFFEPRPDMSFESCTETHQFAPAILFYAHESRD